MSVEIWKIEQNLCRCCHSDGAFDNLAEPQVNLDQEDIIYSNMLKECFNIEILPVPGELCASTYTICKPCILKLQDASSFKKQVLECEGRFMELYLNNAIRGIDSEKESVKEEDVDSEAEFKDTFISLDDDNDEEYDIKQDEDDPEPDELDLNLKTRKTKMKQKNVKSKTNRRSKDVVKKRKNPETKGKKDKTREVFFKITTAEDGTTDFTCTICQHVFKKRQNFTQHYKHVHLKQRPKLISCHLCDVKVPASSRAFHMEEHGIPAPACGACGKKFSYPFQVLQHQKYFHMGERKFACDHCDLRFRTSYRLSKHKVKHTGERKFKCDLCSKAFKWKNNLRIHVMMHLNDRRHACTVCEMSFVQISSLQYHIVKKHPHLV